MINKGKPVSLYSNILNFRDSNESFKLDGDLLEAITKYEFNIDHSNQQDRKLMYEFAKEMNFNIKEKDKKAIATKAL